MSAGSLGSAPLVPRDTVGVRRWSERLLISTICAAVLGVGGVSAVQSPVYRVYVANESSDMVSRVAFSEERGAWVEKETPVGLMPGDIDGAHGIRVSEDGQYWYVTIAHGAPYGSVWKFAAGPDTLVDKSQLGRFPATMAVTPDGEFLLAANFNLHGDMVPSTVSVVYTPTMQELAKVETCVMPHGSRINAEGTKQYSACMHSQQVVEIDLESFEVSARLDMPPGCNPTWVEPGEGERANRFVYVACNKADEVLEVDVELGAVSRRFPTGRAPYNLDVTADGSLLVATLKAAQAVVVFDLTTGEELAQIATSESVTHGIVVSPDGHFAFVSNEAVGSTKGTLDVIDLRTLERVASVALGLQPGGIDFWQRNGS